MRRYLKEAIECLVVSAVITLLLVAGGSYLLARYGGGQEEPGQVKGVLTDGSNGWLKEPPGKLPLAELEVFGPSSGDVFFDSSVLLEGRAEAERVLVTLNNGEDRLLAVDSERRWQTFLVLDEGVNRINVLMIGADGKEQVEELVIGFYPAGQSGEDDYVALLGEVKSVAGDDSGFELITGKETVSLEVLVETDIIGVDAELKNAERVGVIALREEDGFLNVKEIRVDLYPYTFYGNVVDVDEDGVMVVERKRPGGVRSTVVRREETRVVNWTEGNSLKTTDWAEIVVGDRVYVNGFVHLKESRATFFAYRVLVRQM